jgi:hypothetical protein
MVGIALFMLASILTSASSAQMLRPDTTGTAAMNVILDHPGVHWESVRMPDQLRRTAHTRAQDVPRFPQEDPKLMNPHNWAKMKVIDGQMCLLRVGTGEYDALWTVSSLEEVKPGANFSLYYVRMGDRDWPHQGPTYCFRGDGTLSERYSTTVRKGSVATQDYLYYRSGKLFRFSTRNTGDRGKSFEWSDEIFARDGTLVGCGYARRGKDRALIENGSWLGEDIGSREYRQRMAAALTAALAPFDSSSKH